MCPTDFVPLILMLDQKPKSKKSIYKQKIMSTVTMKYRVLYNKILI